MTFIDGLGRYCIHACLYTIDLSCFLIQSLSVWRPQRNVLNRAVYSVFVDQMILTGVKSIAIVTFLAMFVGIAIASQLVFIIVSVTGARDLTEILARLILSEIGPLITGFIMIGRSCSAIVVDLGIAKVNGEIEPLKYAGIDVDDYFVIPRLMSLVISQVSLALYFSAVMLFFGMLSSVWIYDLSAQNSLSELLNLVNIASLFRFMVKNLLFGLIIGTVACFHGLSVSNSPNQVSEQMQNAVVRSVVFLFLVDGYFILFT